MKKTSVSYVSEFNDNYIWLVHVLSKNKAELEIIIVDPGDASTVIRAIQEQIQPKAIFVIHHHCDHTAGINRLVDKFQLPVYASINSIIPKVSHPISHGQTITFESMGLSFQILSVPGHAQKRGDN
ncbi:MAG: MBL fold metallo-hydrolase [gamma proteobacterium symbiont of Taylorina sp.]|nr:MBL fold metallo-hydrolase [gamma proteobacterium symbiont of Taylorina sp.]